MKCPVCSFKLQESCIDDIVIDICANCGGVWLDRLELKSIINFYKNLHENQQNCIDKPLIRDDEIIKSCPKCISIKMIKKYFFKIRVQLDECPKCGGTWLDNNEMETLKNIVIAEQIKLAKEIENKEKRKQNMRLILIRNRKQQEKIRLKNQEKINRMMISISNLSKLQRLQQERNEYDKEIRNTNKIIKNVVKIVTAIDSAKEKLV